MRHKIVIIEREHIVLDKKLIVKLNIANQVGFSRIKKYLSFHW